ncbi:MAG: mechanosensitive ion channel domain-containing protein [Rhodospirillaceae bacterium]
MDNADIRKWLDQALVWLEANVLTTGTAIQAGCIVAAFLIALLLARPARRIYSRLFDWLPDRWRDAVARQASELSLPILWLALQLGVLIGAEALELPDRLLGITVSLLTAWVLIRIVSQLIRDETWGRLFAVTAWTVAALNIVGLLDPTLALLDAASLKVGEIRISALTVIKGVITLILLLWLAHITSRLLEQRVQSLPNLTPSIQVLIGKMIKIVLVTIAVLAAVHAVGIDLTALAVFSGALGVGLGFGLQKVVSNFVSGIILLLDRSVKPGDTIAIADYFGRVHSLGARYTSVVTRDGIEHLVPNEELITTRVENWSYSDDLLRLRKTVGVHYKSDVRKAMALCVEAAGNVERILKEPKPVCQLKDFGDSSVDLEIRYWINDPMNGRANVTGELLLGIWDRFQEHGIEIPYPQRDLHLRSSETISFNRDAKPSGESGD